MKFDQMYLTHTLLFLSFPLPPHPPPKVYDINSKIKCSFLYSRGSLGMYRTPMLFSFTLSPYHNVTNILKNPTWYLTAINFYSIINKHFTNKTKNLKLFIFSLLILISQFLHENIPFYVSLLWPRPVQYLIG